MPNSDNLTALTGQSAIVTGGARGLGLGIAQRLAAAGCERGPEEVARRAREGAARVFATMERESK
jgi:NAD(P)-dependent dehydrogenase (short-subunit alcohol dehydrogenase family)